MVCFALGCAVVFCTSTTCSFNMVHGRDSVAACFEMDPAVADVELDFCCPLVALDDHFRLRLGAVFGDGNFGGDEDPFTYAP